MKQKEQGLAVDAIIEKQFTSENYSARLVDNGALVRVYRGGKIRRQRPVPGDRVQIILSPYQLDAGRIVRIYPTNN